MKVQWRLHGRGNCNGFAHTTHFSGGISLTHYSCYYKANNFWEDYVQIKNT